SVVLTPSVDVCVEVNRLSVREGQGIEISHRWPPWCADAYSFTVAEDDAGDMDEIVRPMRSQLADQLLQSFFPLADDHHVRPMREIFSGVIRWFRPSQHDTGAYLLRRRDHRQDRKLCHQVAVEPNNSWSFGCQEGGKVARLAKSRVEHAHRE